MSGSVSLLEGFQELAAENFAENALRKKEAGISRAHPAGVIARQATGGHDAVSVGMMLQLLIPGVQDAEEADFGAEMARIARHFEQRFGTGPE